MSNQSSFTVYSASAGSGKTFTLVKEYLKILLQNKDIHHFKNILAITFTNKAATEMKERVVTNLESFARGDSSEMMQIIKKELKLDEKVIRERAKKIIKAILHDYSAFSITTIDSFTHRIIRNFAHDFGLSLNFDVEFDSQKLIQEAVDEVISQIGIDNELTKALISFSNQRSRDDKTWDISQTLNQLANIYLKETDKLNFLDIADKDFEDYIELQRSINKQIETFKKKIIEIGELAIQIIADAGLDHSDFYRSMLPKHFAALISNWEKAKFFDESRLRNNIVENIFYSKSKTDEIKTQIESIVPQLAKLYFESEKLYSKITLAKLFRENLIPLATVSYVHRSLEKIKTTNNIRLINEFNEIIFKKIEDEPTPFIYERIGEKYQHYFIDEMQDTSILQWKNLMKLIENSLSQEDGSLLLVGDAKQAIYRWRGGESEQFIDLADPKKATPFYVVKNIENLKINYRSFAQIVSFNNSFFQHISNLMNNKSYADLYLTGNRQEPSSKSGGYVQIEFVEKTDKDEEVLSKETIYPQKVYETISNLDSSFEWKDICVLVRTKDQGAQIANYLNERKINIISSDSLLLHVNPNIDFLINLLQAILNPKNHKNRFNLLNFIYDHASTKEDRHQFLSKLIKLPQKDLYKQLINYGFNFKKEIFHKDSLYDAIEYSIRAFKLAQSSDAYLQYFLDVILDFQIKKGSDISGFLTYWEQQKEKLSISMPEGKNAVQIMTIHKAKGLQFPVVIFPYDLNIYRQIRPSLWYPIEEPEKYQGFNKLLIPFRKSLQYTGEIGASLYHKRRDELMLDNFNLLYVTLTRAVEQLYIITDKRLSKSKGENTDYYSGLFINYLKASDLWDLTKQVYSFGDRSRPVYDNDRGMIKKTKIENIHSEKFISTNIADHKVNLQMSSSLLWDTDQGEAIVYGNLLHEILSRIKTASDIEEALKSFVNQGIINEKESIEIRKKIEAVVNHENLRAYFDHNIIVYCEKEIINTEGISIIPDRIVVFPDKKAVIIDYKTGVEEQSHVTQVENYADNLSKMGYEIIEKLLVYIRDEVKVISV